MRVRNIAALLFLTFCLCTGLIANAHAQSFEEALAGFTTDEYSDTDKAITELAASGNPRAADIIGALQDGRLYFNTDAKKVYIKDKSDVPQDAATGTPASGVSADDLSPVRLNNRLRRTVDAALGGLTLLSNDPGRRFDAAQSVFKSREESALSALDTAIGKETDPRIKRALMEARAAILASKTDAAENVRLGAIETIRARGDQDALGLLSGIAAASEGPLRNAAQAGIGAIQAKLALWNNLQNVWYGLSLGSVLLLAAIGLAITFGVMGIINMAHGEMVMIGAYTTFVVQEYIRSHNPALFGMSLFIAIPLAFVVTGIIGIAIERSIIRFLYGRPLETLLATFGLSLILQQAVRTIFGANNREVGAPAFMSGTFDFGGLAITYGRMWIIAFAIIVFIALQLVLRLTPFGLRMRAVTQNRRMASAMGIDTNRIDALAFGLGSGIAGMAGVALSQIDNVSPNLGQSYIIDSFMVVVFGGVGNLWGTLVAAMTLGVANKFLEPFAGAVLGKIVLLIFIILFIQKRPRGLFALKGRAVEA
ncbi:MAG: urea ABC transporter permease subunit UrtB [Methylobacteriaceae bacterium]|nr:urea ABC transporter permease subunit UrtB [Methylobacteriaceae bacterium]